MFKLRFLDSYEKFLYNIWGPRLRSLGQTLNTIGLTVQGPLATDDRLVPSLRNKSFKSHVPRIDRLNFLAPNSAVIGQVSLGEQSSVWYGATLRGDLNEINIGKNSVVQDLVTLSPRKQSGLTVGDNVYIGPNAVIESCTIENNAFIGMGASISNGATVQSYGVVAAGAVIPEGTTVPSYQIWAGNPARYLRDLTNEEKEVLDEFHDEMQSLAKIHSEETEKPFRQIVDERDKIVEQEHFEPEEFALQKLHELGFPMEAEDEHYIEQRVFFKQPTVVEEQYWKKHYDPYEQDLYNFPDSKKN
jgi:carbonic anhydrase/acetyltransferase-like protein (isoleucine patch superfamily)